MSRRKIIIPNWSIDKNISVDKELIEKTFEDFQTGELLINTKPDNISLSVLDDGGQIEGFVTNTNFNKEIGDIKSVIAQTYKQTNISAGFDENGMSTLSGGVSLTEAIIELQNEWGHQGPEGPVGPTGPQGSQGIDGTQGPQGAQGIDGIQGPQGVDGVQGPQGAAGADGVNGADGVQGPQGANGKDATGVQGPQGANGKDATGVQGPQGAAGADGINGADGVQGPQGANGADGTNGADGAQGPKGDRGYQGYQGPQGAVGSNGTNGTQGHQGPMGPRGYQGYQGPQGAAGANGTNGTNGTQGRQGPMGPRGYQGFQGPKGATGAQGPKGDRGYQGFQGPKGANGKDATGVQGPAGPNFTVSSKSDSQLFLLGLPSQNESITNVKTSSTKVYMQSGNLFAESDRTSKTYIEDIKGDLDIIKRIPKVFFYWNDDNDKKRQMGTFAQDLGEYYPEIVTISEDGKYAVNYDKLGLIALAGIDKLYEIIEKLLIKVNNLQDEINKLKK